MNKIVNPQREKVKSRIAWSVAIFLAVIWVIVTVGPFIFMVINSFRDKKMMGRQGVLHFPDPWYFQNYPDVIMNGFFGYFLRSLIIVSISLVLMLIISAFAAYPLARMKFRLRGFLYAGIVAM
ncbi:MAG: carbohydrate ABC transporter permease, partial [Clostridia bacterium]|nr:carbohydrate ABC transporter permease [Clostridia bacterium]